MFDLALSENGDLIITSHRDLAGIDGTALTEQRIKNRLKIPRGIWVYDRDKSLGSNLAKLFGHPSIDVETMANAYVREALQGMRDIHVDQVRVHVEPSDNDITVIVDYHLLQPALPVGVQPFLTTSITLSPIQSLNTEGGF